MTRFVLATANLDKAKEIEAIIGESARLVPRPSNVPEVEETGSTLLENARLKAAALVEATGLPAVADDTGLEVQALGGAPGVLSARYAGEHASYQDNVAKLLEVLSEVPEPRTATFTTVALAMWPDGSEVAEEGHVHGCISVTARGSNGFGYDPVFIPEGGDGRTFAEMEPQEKHLYSHRGAAFTALAARLMT